MSTFGPGDASPNDCAWSGANSFWTNWNTSTFATGSTGRVTAIAIRWDGSNNAPCTTCTGRNDLWNTSNNLVLNTGTYSVVCTAICNGGIGAGTLHNAGTGDLWQSNASYYLGTWRPSSQCTHLPYVNNSYAYAGKSADDGTNSGGTQNWGGLTQGGVRGYGTNTDSAIYVRRGTAWTPAIVYIRRSSAWANMYVYVRRGTNWTILNQIGSQDFEIGPNGVEAILEIDGIREPALLVEEGQKSWFGTDDPTNQSWDWRVPGHYQWEDRPWSGKYASSDAESLAEFRLSAMHAWDKALRDERFDDARALWHMWQPPGHVDNPVMPNDPHWTNPKTARRCAPQPKRIPEIVTAKTVTPVSKIVTPSSDCGCNSVGKRDLVSLPV